MMKDTNEKFYCSFADFRDPSKSFTLWNSLENNIMFALETRFKVNLRDDIDQCLWSMYYSTKRNIEKTAYTWARTYE